MGEITQFIEYTPISISIENVYKGEITEDNFTFYLPQVRFEDSWYLTDIPQPEFEIGERVLVHLSHSDIGPFADGHYYPKLGELGKYQIQEGSSSNFPNIST